MRRKNRIMLGIVAAVLIGVSHLSYAEKLQNIVVTKTVEGGKIEKTISVTNNKGEILIPVRNTMEYLGYIVSWDNSSKNVVINKPDGAGINVQLNIHDGNTQIIDLNKGKYYNGKTEVKLVKGTTFAEIGLLDNMGIPYYYDKQKNTLNLDNKFNVVNIEQDNTFVLSRLNDKDIQKVNKIISDFSSKHLIRTQKEEYLDYRVVEELYEYISLEPTAEELKSMKFTWEKYLGTVPVNTVSKLNRIKSIAGLSGIKMKFEPAIYYNIGGKVNLVAGYVDYSGSERDIQKAHANYIKNFERVSWEILKSSTKTNVRNEISKLLQEIGSEGIKIFLISEGKIEYIE